MKHRCAVPAVFPERANRIPAGVQSLRPPVAVYITTNTAKYTGSHFWLPV